MAVAELLSIGTELLLGQIVNTNSQFLSAQLADIGISCYFQSTVGDNMERIKSSLKLALDRCDVLIITGGLGPTADDLTRQALAEFFGVDPMLDEAALKTIETFFSRRGVAMPVSNRLQAYRPTGSDILPNPHGTAPGIIWKVEQNKLEDAAIANPWIPRHILCFPGVPGEMKPMWQDTAVPYLVAEFGQATLWSCDLKHYGIGESALAEKYAHLLDLTSPTVAPYASHGECKLRVTAKAKTAAEAQKIAQPIIDQIIKESGHYYYGQDNDTLESVVARLLIGKKMTIATAESCTGGLLSKRLTDIPGSSAFVSLNVVTYANSAKANLLGVSEEILASVGAVSPETAEAMATGVRALSKTDIGLSITGVAGPDGGTAEKPVGLVYVGLAFADRVEHVKLQYPSYLTRQEIRLRTASDALNLVRLKLQ